ncbi:LysM peptidoglycan-binding domain-containing protein [Metallumcola ferriviriculae]|uniref:LysM peptidoglycan-binding domain-containing protein n=1 Tax=Metallumcola ferriviriculae TaxID=3039180 RepID=A0AAU0UL92_9FIRM|nr:LysM peptidoglycan-binding domain-containing protein [Desulfitibacteraceae bacterium MK1]
MAGLRRSIRILICSLVFTLTLALAAQAAGLGERTLRYGMTGEDVGQLQQSLQQRGYYQDYRVDGIYGPGTLKGVQNFQRDQALAVTGVVAGETMDRLVPQQAGMQLIRATHLVARGDTLWLLSQRYGTTVSAIMAANGMNGSIIYIGQTLAIPAAGEVKMPTPSRGGNRSADLVSWDQAKEIFAMYDYAVVTDVATGIAFKVQRRGGSLHADSQPLTAVDTAKMKQIYGEWSWARRAITVTVDGRTMAASMNGMPHGDGAIKDNNFPGHFCIHFLGSRTHGTKSLDPAHQQAVRVAAGLE